MGGAGFGALLLAILVIWYCHKSDSGGDIGCLNLLALPLLPLGLLFGGADKLNTKAIEFGSRCHGRQFDMPPSMLLKVLVAMSCIGVWVLGIAVLADYDDSGFWMWMVIILFPLACINLYMLWLKTFFVWLGRLKKWTAFTIVVVSVILIIVFWIFAIKAYCYYTSLEYLSEYWKRKYSVI